MTRELNKKQKKSIAIDEMVLPTAFDKNGHRNIYISKMRGVVERKVAIGLNLHDIIRFTCYLQNWGMYTSYDESAFNKSFMEGERHLIDILNELLDNPKIKEKIFEAMKFIVRTCYTEQRGEKRYYHSDFIEDLKMLCNLIKENKFYNFIEPNIYSEEAWAWTQEFFNSMGLHNLIEGK